MEKLNSFSHCKVIVIYVQYMYLFEDNSHMLFQEGIGYI